MLASPMLLYLGIFFQIYALDFRYLQKCKRMLKVHLQVQLYEHLGLWNKCHMSHLALRVQGKFKKRTAHIQSKIALKNVHVNGT
jgi:hypothetical protein